MAPWKKEPFKTETICPGGLPPVTVQRSRRKTIALSITRGLQVLVKAPVNMPRAAVEEFVERHRGWLEGHLRLQQEHNENAVKHRMSPEQLAELTQRARRLAVDRVAYYGRVMGLAPEGVRITQAKTRWGSCSGKNRLCFSLRIALLPPEAADYIVVHELAHLREKNHGPRFYAVVAACMPDYRERIVTLRRAERELGVWGA